MVVSRPLKLPPSTAIDVTNFTQWFNDTHLNAALSSHTPRHIWCRAKSTDVLHVTVIGVSVTAGCGAGWELGNRARCLVQNGWVRRTADAYQRLGAALGLAQRVEWSIWPKNAAPLRFWMQCTADAFQLSPATGVVFVEIEPTVSTSDWHQVLELVQHLRISAPNAAIGFIMWPTKGQFHNDNGLEEMVRKAAATSGFDVAHASVLLNEAVRHGVMVKRYYADSVHPNGGGHELLAALAAAWLARQMSSSASQCPDNGRATLLPPAPPALVPPTMAATEWCYTRADELPIASPLAPGWQLVNDGGAKDVTKLGYSSTLAGESLLLGPILPDVRCGLFDVQLGYLVSWRREQGALRISCDGRCTCMPTYKYRWNHPRAHEPFPELQSWTYARVTPVSSGTLTNASTTKIARFMLVLLDAETITMPRQPVAACSIRVTHVRGDSARANAPSRIRVDGLSLKLSSCATQCIAMRHANHAGGNMSRARLNDSTARCSAGASERRRGFLSRQCVGCDSDVKGMTVQGP